MDFFVQVMLKKNILGGIIMNMKKWITSGILAASVLALAACGRIIWR